MQTPSTSTGQRDPLTRTRKTLSPINAAQRAGYKLDAVPVAGAAQATPTVPGHAPAGRPSTPTQPH
ncbi:hypothetical protein [Hydrogenophaga sp. OTU3427]|uniref:hypothetical protein n=1 Tax=Hydrogenophaga sp. OTU3427 TaxID=3043856 RepID=UPI00313B4C7D